MEIIVNWIIEIKNSITAKGFLSVSSFFISLLFFIIALLRRSKIADENSLVLKIAASLLIASITYLSDSGFAYAIAIFIIATLITNIDFILNLAGVMRDSKAWLGYRQSQMNVATEDEKKSWNKNEEPPQVKNEIKEVIQEQTEKENKKEGQKDLSKVKSFDEYSFEKEVFDKLGQLKIFGQNEINRSIKLEVRGFARFIFDGFVKRKNEDIIIEVKFIKSALALSFVLEKTKQSMNELRVFNSTKNRFVNIKSLIVILDEENTYTNTLYENNIAVLKYNIERGVFTNTNEVKRWLSETPLIAVTHKQQIQLKKDETTQIIASKMINAYKSEFEIEYPKFNSAENKTIEFTLRNAQGQSNFKPITLERSGLMQFEMYPPQPMMADFPSVDIKANCDITIVFTVIEYP